MDSKSHRFLIACCFAIAAIDSLRGDPGVTFLPRFIPFIGYFLARHYLSSTNHEMNSRSLVSIFFVCGMVVALAAGALFPVLGLGSCRIMYDYLNPMVIVMSMCIFVQCKKMETMKLAPAGLIRALAPLTLGVYLIHPLWLWSLAEFSVTDLTIHPVVGIPVTTMLAFTLSAMSAALLAKTPFLRRTVG